MNIRLFYERSCFLLIILGEKKKEANDDEKREREREFISRICIHSNLSYTFEWLRCTLRAEARHAECLWWDKIGHACLKFLVKQYGLDTIATRESIFKVKWSSVQMADNPPPTSLSENPFEHSVFHSNNSEWTYSWRNRNLVK